MTDAQLAELERLAKASKSGLPSDGIKFALSALDADAILSLIAEVRELRKDAESWRAHMREVERVQDLECRGFGRDAALAQGEEG